MSNRIKKHAALLRHISTAKPNRVKAIIKTADKDEINVLCECALNVLKGVVSLNTQQRQRLRKHKNRLRTLVDKKSSVTKKKQLLQTGGFLGSLLGPIIGILGSLLGGGR